MGRNTHALATGLFLLVLITALTITVYWLGNFQRERDLYVISTRASVTGLNPESTVFYRGIAVGKVLKVYFDPEEPLTILIPIEVDKGLKLTRGVYATLRLKGVTGLTQIDLQESWNDAERLPVGDHADSRIPLLPSMTDRLMDTGLDILAKAEVLMTKIDGLLSLENQQEGIAILRNLNVVSKKLIDLEDQTGKVLAGLPGLTANAQNSLRRFDELTLELKKVAHNVKELTDNTADLAASGAQTGDVLVTTTLPQVNTMLTDLQKTIQQVKRVAEMMENNPQAFILGPEPAEPGPGEPGYEVLR
ncbi:MAG: mammalian cell entry protein [Gammaproteobacteria bacterium HGW-Gammaproteobacteria-3]|nr:MAG: mammalian cell entry protein [Gammaproteobacteria bacterium HGW-Gammaproteobacteria-3]